MKKNASSKLLWVMLVIGIGIFILGAVKRKSGDVFRSAVTNSRPADRNTIILTTNRSEPIMVESWQGFDWEIRGYAEETFVWDADHPERGPRSVGPGRGLNTDGQRIRRFQFQVNPEKKHDEKVILVYSVR